MVISNDAVAVVGCQPLWLADRLAYLCGCVSGEGEEPASHTADDDHGGVYWRPRAVRFSTLQEISQENG